MNRADLLTTLVSVGVGPTGPLAERTPKIRDNSFLIEEAYNQEPGVIQHYPGVPIHQRHKLELYVCG